MSAEKKETEGRETLTGCEPIRVREVLEQAAPVRAESRTNHDDGEEAEDGTAHRTYNGKVERYNRILAEELLYARVWTSEDQRAEAIKVWNVHYNYHRAHTAVGDQPPASQLRTGVTNVQSQNT